MQQNKTCSSLAGSASTNTRATKGSDPVDAVANDPEKMKKLLEKLLVQSVAHGDTSVMEEIIRDVNNEEKKMARFVLLMEIMIAIDTACPMQMATKLPSSPSSRERKKINIYFFKWGSFSILLSVFLHGSCFLCSPR